VRAKPSLRGDRAPLVWALRPYGNPGDWLLIMDRLASMLGVLYPRGDLWLSRRLDDVEDGRAYATLAMAGTELCGIAIESPKPARAVKLSTLWVAPSFRDQGIGSAMLERCTNRWLGERVPRAWITANESATPGIARLTRSRGFRLTACERDRYGIGRHEWIFHWTPEYLDTVAPASMSGAPVGSPG